MNRKNYCILPFVHTAIESNGDVKACCLTPPFKTDSGHPFNLNQHHLNDVFESMDYKKFIASFLQDRRDSKCNTCWSSDDAGSISNRVKFTEWFSGSSMAQQNYLLDRKLSFLEIKVGNICNLKCRICGPHNSSLAGREAYAIDGQQEDLDHIEKSKWINLDSIWNDLSHLQLTSIHIMGGEPLLDRTHIKLLEELVTQGKSREISLWYNTNGTLYPTAFFEIWKNFKSVLLSVSIDDIGPRFEYQRFPAKWSKVERNLIELYKLNNPVTQFRVTLDVCWSIFNICYAHEIIAGFESLMRDHDMSLGNDVADSRHFYTGEYFSPKSLSQSQRQFYLESLKAGPYYKDSKYGDLIDCLITDVDFDNYSPEVEVKRLEQIKKKDKYRGQSFSEVFTKLSGLEIG